ncbi:MAG TPA: hypothetical protein PL137_16635, partial [Nocardioides sp.]|nr:hypothetical protein [Nocardioides sp.]
GFDTCRFEPARLAALADARLGQVEAVAEGGAGSVAPVAFAMAKADVGLQPGETSLTAMLTVTWSLS